MFPVIKGLLGVMYGNSPHVRVQVASLASVPGHEPISLGYTRPQTPHVGTG